MLILVQKERTEEGQKVRVIMVVVVVVQSFFIYSLKEKQKF